VINVNNKVDVNFNIYFTSRYSLKLIIESSRLQTFNDKFNVRVKANLKYFYFLSELRRNEYSLCCTLTGVINY
jgi:hypothetical protein